ncbi:hypothetical protein [Variovorax guangxiensis]|uniref:hypothetical protein n=1 Tax=Variovorax guangxiensis TaxID=1775474 RepID=UPI00112B2769|nr:hypothetical protein [Variovorax guangxiensis]
MKFSKGDALLAIGILLVFGPWLLGLRFNALVYVVMLVGAVLTAISGYGAQMAQMGQKDTGQELIEETLAIIKKKTAVCFRKSRIRLRRWRRHKKS